jgi:hypothetical protein
MFSNILLDAGSVDGVSVIPIRTSDELVDDGAVLLNSSVIGAVNVGV